MHEIGPVEIGVLVAGLVVFDVTLVNIVRHYFHTPKAKRILLQAAVYQALAIAVGMMLLAFSQ